MTQVRFEQRNYREWLNGVVTDNAKRLGLNVGSPEAALAHHGYFMTVTFSWDAMRRMRSINGLGCDDVSIHWDTVNSLYAEILKSMFGDKYDKAKFAGLWPMLIAGLDFEGSRYARQLTEADRHLTNGNVHFHGVWLVRPDTHADFEAYVSREDLVFDIMDYGPVDAIEIVPFNPEKGIEYGFKGHMKTMSIPSSREEMRFYPNPTPTSDVLHYPWINKRRKANKVIRRMRKAIRLDRREVLDGPGCSEAMGI